MSVHDWKTIEAGVFHAMHHNWITDIAAALNRGLLPTDYYALPEQIASGRGPDVLTLKGPPKRDTIEPDPGASGGVALADEPPKDRHHLKAEADLYARKAKAIVIRHIAIIEIVSPGNKSSRNEFRSFVGKAVDFLCAGVHLLLIDVFPPGTFDPHGIHPRIWDEFIDNEFELPADKPLTLASYLADESPQAFVEPFAVGDRLVDMPLFLNADTYIPTPLEATYESAFSNMPAYWREVIEQA